MLNKHKQLCQSKSCLEVSLVHSRFCAKHILISSIQVPKSEAIKHDQDKPDLSLISLELMEAVARVRMFGAKKYSRDNWKKGFSILRSVAAALRHTFLFLAGETLDPESGEPHIAHAICCYEHVLYDMKHHPENDDRYKV